ncbi:MAG: hypothetical protein HDR37_04020 [Treponema sp.]|nr:hypothetical protein [Treponema sp.]
MADGTDENVYVVAPGVTVYGINNEFHEGEVITPADVGSLTNFRTLVVLGKIIVSDGGGGQSAGGQGFCRKFGRHAEHEYCQRVEHHQRLEAGQIQ